MDGREKSFHRLIPQWSNQKYKIKTCAHIGYQDSEFKCIKEKFECLIVKLHSPLICYFHIERVESVEN